MIYPFNEFNEDAVRTLLGQEKIKIDLAHHIVNLDFGDTETITQIQRIFKN